MPEDATTQNANTGDGGGSGDGAQSQSLGWKTELPEALRSHEAFAAYGSKADLYKGVAELHTTHKATLQKLTDTEGRIATSYIPKLGENPTDEQRAAYFAAIGRPEKADDYEVALTEGMDNSLAPWFKKTAHELGMPKDMAKGLSAAWNGMISEMVKAENIQRQKALTDALDTQKKEWGADFDKNAETVRKAFSSIPGGDALAQIRIQTADGKEMLLGNHPVAMAVFLDIGKRMLNDSAPGGTGGGQQPQDGVIHYDWGKTSGG